MKLRLVKVSVHFFMLARDEEWVYRHNVCGRQEGRGEEGKTVEVVGKPNFAS